MNEIRFVSEQKNSSLNQMKEIFFSQSTLSVDKIYLLKDLNYRLKYGPGLFWPSTSTDSDTTVLWLQVSSLAGWAAWGGPGMPLLLEIQIGELRAVKWSARESKSDMAQESLRRWGSELRGNLDRSSLDSTLPFRRRRTLGLHERKCLEMWEVKFCLFCKSAWTLP